MHSYDAMRNAKPEEDPDEEVEHEAEVLTWPREECERGWEDARARHDAHVLQLLGARPRVVRIPHRNRRLMPANTDL